MVMEEMKEPKPAYILKRGSYDQHGDRVTADTQCSAIAACRSAAKSVGPGEVAHDPITR